MILAMENKISLPLEQLENLQPILSEFAHLMVYLEVNIAFLDGEPFGVDDVETIHLALVAACTAVHTHTPRKRSWDTPIGPIEVEARSFNILINGIEHTPETVDRYSQDLYQALEALNPNH